MSQTKSHYIALFSVHGLIRGEQIGRLDRFSPLLEKKPFSYFETEKWYQELSCFLTQPKKPMILTPWTEQGDNIFRLTSN